MKEIEEILLKDIIENSLDIFTKKELLEVSSMQKTETEIALRELSNRDIILTIERGKYCKFDFRDEFVIGYFLGRDGGIAYWTALNYYGLTEQIPNTIFVQTSFKKQSKKIFGVTYVFVQIKKEKLIGYKTMGYGNHQYKITDIEKTIVDCFDLPQHSGSYPEIIKAFARAKLNAKKLIIYCKAVNNIAVTKRLAFLSELLNKPNMKTFIDYALAIRNEKYNLFEHNGNVKGENISRWHLILNISREEILNIADT